MSKKTQADTAFCTLLNRKDTRQRPGSESFQRIKMDGTERFKGFDWEELLRFVISRWVIKKIPVSRDILSYINFMAAETVIRNTNIERTEVLSNFVTLYFSYFDVDVMIKTRQKLTLKLIQKNLGKARVLLNPRTLGSQAKRYEPVNLKRLTLHSYDGRSRTSFPEVSRIGVGYRDKGGSRESSFDGSPSWQEVAMSNQPHLQEEVKRPKNSLERLKLSFLEDPGRRKQKTLERGRKLRSQERDWIGFF